MKEPSQAIVSLRCFHAIYRVRLLSLDVEWEVCYSSVKHQNLHLNPSAVTKSLRISSCFGVAPAVVDVMTSPFTYSTLMIEFSSYSFET